jgi:hypothetical protein
MSGGFSKGIEVIDAAIAKSASGGKFVDTSWLNWKNGETKFLRFYTDLHDAIPVVNHENVERANGKTMSFICRKDHPADPKIEVCELCDLFERTKGQKDAQGKKIEQARPRTLVWALAVVRDEIRNEQGTLAGYADAVTDILDDNGRPELKEDGTPKKRPVIGIVRQGTKNFWPQPRAYYQRYGTLRDRDYEITRRGDNLDTAYTVIPCDPLEIPNIDERYAKFIPDLEEILTRMSSQEFYDKHLRGEGGGTETSTAEAPPATPVSAAEIPADDTEFARLQQRREDLAATAVAAPVENGSAPAPAPAPAPSEPEYG